MANERSFTIGALLAKSGGSLKTGPFGTLLKAREYTRKGVPLISVGELGHGVFHVDDTTPRVPPEITARLPEYVLREGDIVFARKGAVDRLARVSKEQAGWFLGSDGIRLRLPDSTDSRFMAYQLQSEAARAWILQHATGTTMPTITQDVISRLPVHVPPLHEQREIARVLGALDAQIALSGRLNQTLEAMARALFKSWFSDFDPVRDKAAGRTPHGLDAQTAQLFSDGFTDSALGPIPRGWQARPLAEVAALNPPRRLKVGAPAPFVEMASLSTVGHRPASWPRCPAGAGARFQNGDTLLARITPCLENGKLGYVDFLDDGQLGWGSAEYIVLCPREPLPKEWGYLLARDPLFTEFAAQNMEGTTGRQRVTIDALGRYLVALPPAALGQRFGQLVRPLFRQMARSDDTARVLHALRDSLLPQLLRGDLPSVDQALAQI
jgi:type I restriction enzyme S subunit